MSVDLSEFLVPTFFDVQVQRTDEKILFLSAAGRILASVRAHNVWKYVSEASLMHFSMEMNKIPNFFPSSAGRSEKVSS